MVEYFEIGHISNTHGLKGEVKVRPFTAKMKDYEKLKNIFIDFHAEATSEKIAFGLYLDGKVSVVFGTHTHVQTADEQILKGGTGYITDLGMTGPKNSVLGVKSDIIINRLKDNGLFYIACVGSIVIGTLRYMTGEPFPTALCLLMCVGLIGYMQKQSNQLLNKDLIRNVLLFISNIIILTIIYFIPSFIT